MCAVEGEVEGIREKKKEKNSTLSAYCTVLYSSWSIWHCTIYSASCANGLVRVKQTFFFKTLSTYCSKKWVLCHFLVFQNKVVLSIMLIQTSLWNMAMWYNEYMKAFPSHVSMWIWNIPLYRGLLCSFKDVFYSIVPVQLCRIYGSHLIFVFIFSTTQLVWTVSNASKVSTDLTEYLQSHPLDAYVSCDFFCIFYSSTFWLLLLLLYLSFFFFKNFAWQVRQTTNESRNTHWGCKCRHVCAASLQTFPVDDEYLLLWWSAQKIKVCVNMKLK